MNAHYGSRLFIEARRHPRVQDCQGLALGAHAVSDPGRQGGGLEILFAGVGLPQAFQNSPGSWEKTAEEGMGISFLLHNWGPREPRMWHLLGAEFLPRRWGPTAVPLPAGVAVGV